MVQPLTGLPHGSYALPSPFLSYGYDGTTAYPYQAFTSIPGALPSAAPYVTTGPFNLNPPGQHRPTSASTSSRPSHPSAAPLSPSPHVFRHAGSLSMPYPSYGIPAPSLRYPTVPALLPQARNEPPYMTVNPFSLNLPRANSYYTTALPSRPSAPSPSSSPHSGHNTSQLPYPSTLPLPASSSVSLRRSAWGEQLVQSLIFILVFIFIGIPRQIYLHLLLRLPTLYFSRVSRLFEDADLSLPDIRRMAAANADQWKDGSPGFLMTAWIPNEAAIPPHLLNFRHSWEGFVDSLLREWKTQNVVSALMLSAILTMLQIDSAGTDPIVRTTAILSLVSALMSLIFGSIYIIRFGTMRKMYKAACWADEAQKGSTPILWNVWILLAVPAIWLAWSLILFVTCIMAFTWRTGATEDSVDTSLSQNAARGLRVGVSVVLTLALVYFFLILKTFREYGDVMDKKWTERVVGWAQAQDVAYTQIDTRPEAWQPHSSGSRSRSRGRTRVRSRPVPDPGVVRRHKPKTPISPDSRPHSARRPSRPMQSQELPSVRSTPALSFDRPFVVRASPLEMTPFAAVKVMDLRSNPLRTYLLPSMLQERDILLADWLQFTETLEAVWNDNNRETPASPIDVEPGFPPAQDWAAGLIHLWNTKFFHARFTEAILCKEEPIFGPEGYAVFLIHRSISPHAPPGPMPSPLDYELKSITVIQLVEDANGKQWGNQLHIIASPNQRCGEKDEDESGVPVPSSTAPVERNGPSTSRDIPPSDSLLQPSLPVPSSPPPDSGSILS
ncbi:hypothetical protein B0H19DRAFT_1067115 [Mycena capillaripes]|nr:hypothetical protein B0H19DRAFT_1067115 [Mycena capillaripes]